MGGIKVYVSDATEQRFRKASMQVFGYHKGSLSSAAEQAFEDWSKNAEQISKIVEVPRDPIAAIEGLLSKTNIPSVELQHRISDIRARKMIAKMRR